MSCSGGRSRMILFRLPRRTRSNGFVSGRQVHDARLAAVMLAHGVSHVLTFNVEDFRRYPGIVTVNPHDV